MHLYACEFQFCDAFRVFIFSPLVLNWFRKVFDNMIFRIGIIVRVCDLLFLPYDIYTFLLYIYIHIFMIKYVKKHKAFYLYLPTASLLISHSS